MSGYQKVHSAWADLPARTTPLLAAGLQQWDDAIYDLKRRWFNVKDYGAVGNGSTDDTVAIQAAITDCHTAGGGTVYCPAGAFLVSAPLDFSAFSGTPWAGITFRGAGSGERQQTPKTPGVTRIVNASGTTALSFISTSSASYITGVVMRDFIVFNTVALGAAVYTIDCQGVVDQLQVEHVVLQGNNLQGNGIRHIVQDGAWVMRNMVVDGFPGDGAGTGGTCFFVGDGTLPPGFTAIRGDGWVSEGGDGLLQSILVARSEVGCDIYGDMIAVTLSNWSVNLNDTATGVGVRMRRTSGSTAIGVHVERAGVAAFTLDSLSYGNTIIGGIAAAGVSAGDGVHCDGHDNTIENLVVYGNNSAMPIGVKMTANAANNKARCVIRPGGTGVTAQYSDSSTAKTNQFGMPNERLAVGTLTGDVSVTGTTEGSPTTIVDLASATFDATTCVFQLTAAEVIPGTNSVTFDLYDVTNSTVVGEIGTYFAKVPVCVRYKFQPTAGTHQYRVRGWVDAGTGTLKAGAAGSGAFVNAVAEIRRG